MKKLLVYYYPVDLTTQSTNSIVRLTASLMNGLQDKVEIHYFFEKEDKLKLLNGYAHPVKISFASWIIRKLNNTFWKNRIHWHQLKNFSVERIAAKLSTKKFDAILLLELEKVNVIKKFFPESKIIYWMQGPSAICKPDYLAKMQWVDYFVSPSKTSYYFLLQKILPDPLTALFYFMPNWCESIFFKRDQEKISKLKLQYKIQDNARVFIYCGGNQKRKGYTLINSIIKILARKVKTKIVFILCGEDISIELPAPTNVQIINAGTVYPQQLAGLYAITDFGLHPSLFYDTCPLVLIEMIHSGVLPVTSDIGGIKEIVGEEFQFLIKEPNNLLLWVAKIEEMISMEMQEKERLTASLRNRIMPQYNRENAIHIMKEIIEF